jgi:hypothetical protein
MVHDFEAIGVLMHEYKGLQQGERPITTGCDGSWQTPTICPANISNQGQ